MSGPTVSIPAAKSGEAGISIEWTPQQRTTNPVSGETFTSDNWTTQAPRACGELEGDVLRTSEQDLETRTTVVKLANYIQAIENGRHSLFATESKDQP